MENDPDYKTKLKIVKAYATRRMVTRSQTDMIVSNNISPEWYDRAANVQVQLQMSIDAERLILQRPARRLSRRLTVDTKFGRPKPKRIAKRTSVDYRSPHLVQFTQDASKALPPFESAFTSFSQTSAQAALRLTNDVSEHNYASMELQGSTSGMDQPPFESTRVTPVVKRASNTTLDNIEPPFKKRNIEPQCETPDFGYENESDYVSEHNYASIELQANTSGMDQPPFGSTPVTPDFKIESVTTLETANPQFEMPHFEYENESDYVDEHDSTEHQGTFGTDQPLESNVEVEIPSTISDPCLGPIFPTIYLEVEPMDTSLPKVEVEPMAEPMDIDQTPEKSVPERVVYTVRSVRPLCRSGRRPSSDKKKN